MTYSSIKSTGTLGCINVNRFTSSATPSSKMDYSLKYWENNKFSIEAIVVGHARCTLGTRTLILPEVQGTKRVLSC